MRSDCSISGGRGSSPTLQWVRKAVMTTSVISADLVGLAKVNVPVRRDGGVAGEPAVDHHGLTIRPGSRPAGRPAQRVGDTGRRGLPFRGLPVARKGSSPPTSRSMQHSSTDVNYQQIVIARTGDQLVDQPRRIGPGQLVGRVTVTSNPACSRLESTSCSSRTSRTTVGSGSGCAGLGGLEAAMIRASRRPE